MAKKPGGLGRDFYSIFDDNILESVHLRYIPNYYHTDILMTLYQFLCFTRFIISLYLWRRIQSKSGTGQP